MLPPRAREDLFGCEWTRGLRMNSDLILERVDDARRRRRPSERTKHDSGDEFKDEVDFSPMLVLVGTRPRTLPQLPDGTFWYSIVAFIFSERIPMPEESAPIGSEVQKFMLHSFGFVLDRGWVITRAREREGILCTDLAFFCAGRRGERVHCSHRRCTCNYSSKQK